MNRERFKPLPYKDPERQKEYLANHYKLNKDKYRESSRQTRSRRKDFVNECKSKPCADCKVEYPPYVMEFDHISNNKVMEINRMIRYASFDALIEEMAKCEIVCASCHAIRTWERLQN